jgi:small subunit ribosomal protein S9
MAEDEKGDAKEPEELEAEATEPTEEPAAEAETPAEEPTAEPEAPAEEPVAEAEEPAAEPAAEEPAAEPAAEEPAAEPAAEEPAAEPAAAAEEPASEPAAEAPEVVVEGDEVLTDEDLEEIEERPRVKPEIPGADLEVDIVREDEAYRESRWDEDGDEEEPSAEGAEQEDLDEPQPIADAAIDLAAGARYTATGKRKTAVARVILKPGTGAYMINGRTLEQHFPRFTLQRNIRQPLEQVGYESRMDVVATMHGGGVSAQAGALRHGISRALIEADPNLRSELKRRGFLTRDARVKERKKAGLKKARKRPQFSKR